MSDKPPPEPFSPEFMVNPHPTYAYLREHDPVCPVSLPTGEKVWLVTRHADVRQGLSDARLSTDPAKRSSVRPYRDAPPDFEAAVNSGMLNSDPPVHTRLRDLVAGWLTLDRVEQFNGRMKEIADNLLDALAERTVIDVVRDYAEPFASRVVADLMGISHQNHARLSALVDEVGAALLNKHTEDDLLRPSAEVVAIARQMIEDKRRKPADDLLSFLVAAHDDDRLSTNELTSLMHLLLVAGHEGPANLIASAIHLLLSDRTQLVRLVSQPDLLPTAVEEFIRMEAPLDLAIPRHCDEPLRLSGVTIPAGEPVVFSLLSSGRDEARFSNPDQLDVGRRSRHHLGFGRGRHYCVGSMFARAECRVALGALLSRFPVLTAASPDHVEWKASLISRGLAKLLVRL